ncbi:NUDIX domain-containing protein [Phytomonospora sp. NPDC050363]|uniref:NUDIX domain-containing protein n=1 Tax=Phytomonospora sp. NPDC050363 TaxID=3155642 RepID=UPI0033E1E741
MKTHIDIAVTALDEHGHRWLAATAHPDGWGLPTGAVLPGSTPIAARKAILETETGLTTGQPFTAYPDQTRPDLGDPTRTITAGLVHTYLGSQPRRSFPRLSTATNGERVEWVRAENIAEFGDYIKVAFEGRVLPAHAGVIAAFLSGEVDPVFG